MSAFCPQCGYAMIGHPTACDPARETPRINPYARGFNGALYWTVRDLILIERARKARAEGTPTGD
jgi:hypothetical protein